MKNTRRKREDAKHIGGINGCHSIKKKRLKTSLYVRWMEKRTGRFVGWKKKKRSKYEEEKDNKGK